MLLRLPLDVLALVEAGALEIAMVGEAELRGMVRP